MSSPAKKKIENSVETKHCKGCNSDKPVDPEHWYFDKGKPRSTCKECFKATSKTREKGRYKRTPEKCRARQKRFKQRKQQQQDAQQNFLPIV
jgi:hypothetical protein